MIQDTIRQIGNWSVNSSGSQMNGISASSPLLPHHFSCSTITVNSVLKNDTSSHYTWILDSSATNHITCHKHLLYSVESLLDELYLPDGKTVAITHIS